ncbi:MAG: NAD(P)-dependent oxidoreductase [Desulfocapsaceae bacterium]|nr:NAD(P)-dependent oxidoreductase [Desulfocapsaceae bacterium]
MHIGFIGLGHLGKAIATRLLDCSHTLTVWNRTPAKAQGMRATVAQSPAAVADCELIFLCMFDSTAVNSVLTGDNGLLSGRIAGKIIVDVSTNHFKNVTAFHELCAKAGCTYLESPVLGSVVPATQGALTVLVSGSEAGFKTVRPVLENIGKHLFYMGEPGQATKMKLINNLALGTFMATLAEALVMAEDCGMDRAEVLDILAAGGGSSLVLNAKKEKLRTGDFSTHFSSALIYKDLHCLQDLAYEQKKTLFTGAVIKELFARTFEQGIAQEDFSAIYKIFKRKN